MKHANIKMKNTSRGTWHIGEKGVSINCTTAGVVADKISNLWEEKNRKWLPSKVMISCLLLWSTFNMVNISWLLLLQELKSFLKSKRFDEDEGWSFVIVVDEGWVVVWIGSETVIATFCSDSVTCIDSETTVSTTGSGIAFCGENWFSGWFEVGVEMFSLVGGWLMRLFWLLLVGFRLCYCNSLFRVCNMYKLRNCCLSNRFWLVY